MNKITRKEIDMMSPNKGDLIRLDWDGKAMAIVEYVKDGKVGISRVVKSDLEKDFNELDLRDFQSDKSISLLADRLYPNTKSKFESAIDPDYDEECEDDDTITDSINKLKNKLESIRSKFESKTDRAIIEALSDSLGSFRDVKSAVSALNSSNPYSNDIFSKALTALVEPRFSDRNVESSYQDFMDNSSNSWVGMITSNFGNDWGKLAKYVSENGY